MKTKVSSRLVRSFGRGAAGTSIFYEPCSPAEILAVFDEARSAGKRVVIRGGGHSFHDQALHNGDKDQQIIASTACFTNIEFAPNGDEKTVRLGAGVRWGDYLQTALSYSASSGGPLRIPGSMQTGRKATAGGTLAGDCLSRFSAILGKESEWIESFELVTPDGGVMEVSKESDQELFFAVIGGHGYLGFVTNVTYRLIEIDRQSVARTRIKTFESFGDLVAAQLKIINNAVSSADASPLAVSSVWFTDLTDSGGAIHVKGGVFESWYAPPSSPALPPFALYDKIDSGIRYSAEIMARYPVTNLGIHDCLYLQAKDSKHDFENDLTDFLFFMDGNTVAKERYERLHPNELFPIVQQTFVIPAERAATFAGNCEEKMKARKLRPTECDMLFVRADDALLSANYKMDGFAISLGFEPIEADGRTPPAIADLLKELSVDCLGTGGRIHLVKNVHADKAVLWQMFSPQISRFEEIKRKLDPHLVLQNGFSDHLLNL